MDTLTIVQRGIDYIEDRLCERIELQQVAAAAAMSVPNLYRLFYALTGHPIKEYIRKRRISEAALLLRYSPRAVVDIGFDCGFDSYQAFAKSFKKLTGLTPGEYRKSDFFYSFERIALPEQVDYQEDRQLSALFPEVRVLRLHPAEALAYDYYAEHSHQLEENAFRCFIRALADSGINAEKTRIFGFNLEDDERREAVYGYRMMALTGELDNARRDSELSRVSFPEGLYAVHRIAYGPPEQIVAAWNRLLAEWLPRSTFTLGKQPFLEEYQLIGGSITRMKLCLPVEKKQEPDTIEIVDLPDRPVIRFRADGPDDLTSADDRLIAWLRHHGLQGDGDLQLSMSYSYGASSSENSWHELGVLFPADRTLPARLHGMLQTRPGGRYACMRTGAFGVITGVLDQIYRWLSLSATYDPDETRQWFAVYEPGDANHLERSTSMICYVPVACRE